MNRITKRQQNKLQRFLLTVVVAGTIETLIGRRAVPTSQEAALTFHGALMPD
jgi:hypothetical protein